MTAPIVTIHGASEAQAGADLMKKAFEPRVVEIHDGSDPEHPTTRHVLLTPDGRGGMATTSAKFLVAEYRTAPERRKGTAMLTDLASFIAHVLRFQDEDSAVFVDRSPGAPSLTCVLDYHRMTAEGKPRFGEHRSHYDFPLSDEWVAWTKANNHVFEQAPFAAFVEDRLGDVAAPETALDAAKLFQQLFAVQLASAQRLLELSRGLSVHVGERVKGKIDLATGETQISFQSTHADDSGAPLKIPGAFLLAIPVFKNGPLYQLAARLRYRVREGNVTWFYSLHQPERIIDHAIDEACKRVADETTLPVLQGAPEGA